MIHVEPKTQSRWPCSNFAVLPSCYFWWHDTSLAAELLFVELRPHFCNCDTSRCGLKPTRRCKIGLQSGSERIAVSFGPQPAAASRSPQAFSCRLRMPQRCCIHPHKPYRTPCTASNLATHTATDDSALFQGGCSAPRCNAVPRPPSEYAANSCSLTTISCGLSSG